ncbi:MAG: regulatory protein GemA [Bacillota bacterium]
MTPQQIKLLRTAVSRLDWDEGEYRLMLRNLAGVASCKDLNNTQYEDVMAFLEGMGFPQGTYWRDKVANRRRFADARIVHKIQELHGELLALPSAPGYPLESLVLRFSQNRVNQVSKLRPHEGYQLIEALKAILQRLQLATTDAEAFSASKSRGVESSNAIKETSIAGNDHPALLHTAAPGTVPGADSGGSPRVLIKERSAYELHHPPAVPHSNDEFLTDEEIPF